MTSNEARTRWSLDEANRNSGMGKANYDLLRSLSQIKCAVTVLLSEQP